MLRSLVCSFLCCLLCLCACVEEGARWASEWVSCLFLGRQVLCFLMGDAIPPTHLPPHAPLGSPPPFSRMQRRGRAARFGVVSMCIGSGMGAAAVFEAGDQTDGLVGARAVAGQNNLSRNAVV
jgi:hypothetical protein